MSKTHSRIVARLTLLALALALAPLPSQAAGARLEGYVLAVDGRAADGHRVHLIDDSGRDVGQATTSDEGLYRFRDLAGGSYALGIENPEGRVAPVAAPPIRLGQDELARRDIKLVQADQTQRETVGQENNSFGVYWAGLSPAAKAWSVIGVFVILGVAIVALDDDDAKGSPD
jgi:hypothetical protein